MDKIPLEDYEVEDFIADESFINYHLKSNADDLLFWEQWLKTNPGKKILAAEAIEMIESLSFTISEKEYREESKKIITTINTKSERYPLAQLTGRTSLLHWYQRKKRTVNYILPLLLILVAGGYWAFQFSQRSGSKLTETVNNSGLLLVLTLSDSTIVSLAPHSYLRYPLRFDDKDRNVYLHGNAQFNVKRNERHPFKVYAENIVATVLGTVFNIKSSGDSAIVVELSTGKLNVEIMNSSLKPEQSILLDPNERAVYVRNDKHLYKNPIIPETYVSFRQNNFEEIATRVKNVFGITVINKSASKSWRFTGDFKNSSAKDIIENICLVKKLSFVAKGDTIVIK